MANTLTDPVLVTSEDDSRAWWHFADGTIVPAVRGGDGSGDGGDGGDGDSGGSGGDDGSDSGGDGGTGGEGDDGGDGDDLGESGKAALSKERRARRDAEKRAKAATAELDKLRKEQMTEQERAVAEARAEGEKSAGEKANRRLFAAEVKAAAVDKLTDPDLLTDPDVAQKLLGFDELPVDDDGGIDAAAIAAALDEFLERKPHFKKASATRLKGDADGGARGGNDEGDDKPDLGSLSMEEYRKARRANAG